jgi:CDP-diacylglycerol pyrophosphatase
VALSEGVAMRNGRTDRGQGACVSWGAIAVAVLAWIGASPTLAADPNALWHIVHDQCAPAAQAGTGPAPCAAVDLAGGYAVLKDIRGTTQLLLIPTDRRTGVESPELLAPASPNYWQAAWAARPLFEKLAGGPVPREDVGLAINSKYARSQNQLHIHIDCVKPDVLRTVQANAARIGARWSNLNVDLAGHRYRAMRIKGADLGSRNPFKLLADGDAQAREDMGREALVVIAVSLPGGKPGFILLSDRADTSKNDRASGESLLDHACEVLGEHGRARDDPHPAAAD